MRVRGKDRVKDGASCQLCCECCFRTAKTGREYNFGLFLDFWLHTTEPLVLIEEQNKGREEVVCISIAFTTKNNCQIRQVKTAPDVYGRQSRNERNCVGVQVGRGEHRQIKAE
jgi:hypothetical protein